ncbi:CHRD domain-containing protein [Arcicella lustrica]|uniref:CHRD domain-containing protein n=1 Tax=Arcicella lustrica TaxID=2984196 RepID=A0ABU5SPP0_9BACT|nr:CHRD domain-containing protein [Arcicella sp. DC25W]MEA5429288.1 CHRD domain-containing protein [Arcicella sp. DC25W]
MKKGILKNILYVFLGIIVLGTFGCTQGGELQSLLWADYKVVGDGSGDQMVPSLTNTATGKFSANYNIELNSMTYTLRWANLWVNTGIKDTIVKAGFYSPAAKGENGTAVRSIYIPTTKLLNPTDSTTYAIAGTKEAFNEKEEADLLNGKWYYVIHTKKFPNGIVRGQLSASK